MRGFRKIIQSGLKCIDSRVKRKFIYEQIFYGFVLVCKLLVWLEYPLIAIREDLYFHIRTKWFPIQR